MCKRIFSANVLIQEKMHAMEFSSGINILCGHVAEETLLTLAGIFGGTPLKAFKAEIKWGEGVTLLISGEDGRVFVNNIKKERGNSTQLIKAFHKQRFLNFRNKTHLLDGAELLEGTTGASNLLLKKFYETINIKDDHPLFICNFLERLDEAVDLREVFEALNATGRQIFIAAPHYYSINTGGGNVPWQNHPHPLIHVSPGNIRN